MTEPFTDFEISTISLNLAFLEVWDAAEHSELVAANVRIRNNERRYIATIDAKDTELRAVQARLTRALEAIDRIAITREDYDAGVEIVRKQRDVAIHDAEECRAIAREVLAMDHLGHSARISGEALQTWLRLVALARTVIK